MSKKIKSYLNIPITKLRTDKKQVIKSNKLSIHIFIFKNLLSKLSVIHRCIIALVDKEPIIFIDN